jgi:hypothetical protein
MLETTFDQFRRGKTNLISNSNNFDAKATISYKA